MKLRVAVLSPLLLASIASVLSQPAASQVALKCSSKIYISPMENGLDGYIRARLVDQHVPLKIVMEKENADLIMIGTSQKYQDHWYAATQDRSSGVITITDKGGNFVWSGSAGDRNPFGNLAKHGPEKVAERIVDKLKAACEK